MKRRLYAIKDQLTSFKAPFILENDNVAKREFRAIVNDSKGSIFYAPQYYDLYSIGEFDDETGELVPGKIELVCNGAAVIEENKNV